MSNKSLRQWATVFRGLGNPNRLKILQILSRTKQMSVSALADELGISLKNTSRNLSILANLDLIEFQGRQDRVYYSINPKLSGAVARIFKIVF
ncbi:MAG: winged helix-turn-helix transcriptional regulator [Candidatus Doudnabacteria bacterium]|nr:winged helix-turn-helix transcriptional regulator [Candidatus Doudnabacteria bacterium]